MKIYKELNSKNSNAFKTMMAVYSLWGAQTGIIAGFFVFYIMHSLPVRETIMMLNMGAAMGIILLFAYKAIIKRLGTHNKALAFGNFMLFIADALVVIAYYYPNYAKISAFMNGFIAGGMSVLFATYMESYIMHLYGLEDRAKLTSVKNTVVNLSAAIALFTAYFYYKNVILTFVITELFRLAVTTIILRTKDVPIPDNHSVKNIMVSKKVLLALIAILFLQMNARFYRAIRPKIIEETLGQAMISIGTALSMIITIILFYTALKYTTEYGKIIRRTGWVMVFMSLLFVLSLNNSYTYAAAAIVSTPATWFFIMSIRHYIIKKVPPSETTSVLYSVNILNYVARFFVAIATMIIVGGTTTYYCLTIVMFSMATVFIALSKVNDVKIT